MQRTAQSLLITILCIPAVQAAEPQQRPAKKAAPGTAFEHRFSDDLKQTADSEARLDKWFRDAKFGAFIHFGVYSSLEGEYKGRGLKEPARWSIPAFRRISNPIWIAISRRRAFPRSKS